MGMRHRRSTRPWVRTEGPRPKVHAGTEGPKRWYFSAFDMCNVSRRFGGWPNHFCHNPILGPVILRGKYELLPCALSTKCEENIGSWEFELHPSNKYGEIESFSDWPSFKARLETLPPFGIPAPADNWAP
eukprot:5864088-Prymnesium_polylepis.2